MELRKLKAICAWKGQHNYWKLWLDAIKRRFIVFNNCSAGVPECKFGCMALEVYNLKIIYACKSGNNN